jgi:hypothetical protein
MEHPTVHALAAGPCKGIGADRTVVLVKLHIDRPYQHAIKCWGGDHLLRAHVYTRLINEAQKCRSRQQSTSAASASPT